jgi:predicted MarR family transcription regulator
MSLTRYSAEPSVELTTKQLELLIALKAMERTATREELANMTKAETLENVSKHLAKLKAKEMVTSFRSGKHLRWGLTMAGRQQAQEKTDAT